MGGTVKVSLMRSKRCLDCDEVKQATEFWKLKSSEDGLAYYCKVCFGLRNGRSYRKKQAELGKETRAYRRRSDVPEGKKYCPRCEAIKSVDEFGSNRALKSGLTNYCRPCHSKTMAEIRKRNHGSGRNYLLQLRYGVTEDHVNEMIAEQGGICVICLRAEPKHVDHDHRTGAVRGIACHGCNSGMGQLRDDPIALRRAADYLMGALVKTVPAPGGGTRLSFTVPDMDPVKVAPGGWTALWEADGRYRKESPELGILRVGPVWVE